MSFIYVYGHRTEYSCHTLLKKSLFQCFSCRISLFFLQDNLRIIGQSWMNHRVKFCYNLDNPKKYGGCNNTDIRPIIFGVQTPFEKGISRSLGLKKKGGDWSPLHMVKIQSACAIHMLMSLSMQVRGSNPFLKVIPILSDFFERSTFKKGAPKKGFT